MPSALAVVVHHDDHILWMGGTIQRLRAQGWEWTLVALCVPPDLRRRYYGECRAALGVPGWWMDFRDYQGPGPFTHNREADMEARLQAGLQGKIFDWVFTHSRHPAGEYGGHANHAEVVAVVQALVTKGQLARGTEAIAYFCYSPFRGLAAGPREDGSYYLPLTYSELLFKCGWCMQAPDALTSLANLGYPCPNPEAFEGDGLSLPPPFVKR